MLDEVGREVADGVFVRHPGATKPATSRDLAELQRRRDQAPNRGALIGLAYDEGFDHLEPDNVPSLIKQAIDHRGNELLEEVPASKSPAASLYESAGLGALQGVDAQQVREGAVVDGDGLGDLEEPDQLGPVQALGAGLVAMHLRQPCVDRWVGADEAVDVGEPEVPAHRVHHRHDRGVHQSAIAELEDVQLHVGSLDPGQGVQPAGLAPGKPLLQLVGVQGVGTAGVAGQVGHRRQLGVRYRCWLEGQKVVGSDMESPHAATWQAAQTPLAANAARHPDRIDASPVSARRGRVRSRGY